MLLLPSLACPTQDLAKAVNEEALVLKLEKDLEAKLVEIQDWRKNAPVIPSKLPIPETHELHTDLEEDPPGQHTEVTQDTGEDEPGEEEEEEPTTPVA